MGGIKPAMRARVSSLTWPCYFLLRRVLPSCQRIAGRLLGYLHCQGRWAPFFYYGRSGALFGCCLARLFRQDRAFFLHGPTDDIFHAVDVQHDPTIPSYVLHTPPVSSPCLGANKEIDL